MDLVVCTNYPDHSAEGFKSFISVESCTQPSFLSSSGVPVFGNGCTFRFICDVGFQPQGGISGSIKCDNGFWSSRAICIKQVHLLPHLIFLSLSLFIFIFVCLFVCLLIKEIINNENNLRPRDLKSEQVTFGESFTSKQGQLQTKDNYYKRSELANASNKVELKESGRFKRSIASHSVSDYDQDYEDPIDPVEENETQVDYERPSANTNDVRNFYDLIANGHLNNIDTLIRKLTKKRTLVKSQEKQHSVKKLKNNLDFQNKNTTKTAKEAITVKKPLNKHLLIIKYLKSLQATRENENGVHLTLSGQQETTTSPQTTTHTSKMRIKSKHNLASRHHKKSQVSPSVVDWPSIIDNDSEKTIYESFYELLDKQMPKLDELSELTVKQSNFNKNTNNNFKDRLALFDPNYFNK